MEEKDLKKEKFILLREIIKEIFYFSLIAFFALYFLENLLPCFVSNFFNLNFLVWVALISGLVSVVFLPLEKREAVKPGKKNDIFIFILSLGVGAIIWYNSRELVGFSYGLGIVSFAITLIITRYLLNNDIKNNDKNL